MATRKPLVVINGGLAQLPAGDSLDAPITGGEVYSLINDNASPITIGQVVYVKANGHVDLARANAAGTSRVFGVVQDASIANAASGTIKHDGVVTGLSGLTAGTTYYLDPSTAGAITSTAPSTVGQYVTEVGTALSATELSLDIKSPIAL